MEDIVAVAAAISDRGGILYGEGRCVVDARTPSYPNWQRKRIQNPSSVSSSLTEGTATRATRCSASAAQPCCGPPWWSAAGTPRSRLRR